MNGASTATGRFAWIAVLFWLLVGCASQPKKLPPPAGPMLTLKLERHVTTAESASRRPEAPVFRMWMQAVPGSIYGRANSGRISDSRIEGSGNFHASLGDIESALARLARVAETRSLTFFPASTRVARLAVMSSDWNDPDRNYTTTLRDSRSGEILILFYVDRPCQVHGSLGVHTVDLELKSSGLHWLEMTHSSTGNSEPTRLVSVPPQVIVRLDPS